MHGNHAAHTKIEYFRDKNWIFFNNTLHLIHSTFSNYIYSQHFYEIQSIPMRKVVQVQANFIFLPISLEIAS